MAIVKAGAGEGRQITKRFSPGFGRIIDNHRNRCRAPEQLGDHGYCYDRSAPATRDRGEKKLILRMFVKTVEDLLTRVAGNRAIDSQENNVVLRIVNQAKPMGCNPWA